MLIHDFRRIGERLYSVRKRYGMTQLEAAILSRLDSSAPKSKETALRLLETYLQSLD